MNQAHKIALNKAIQPNLHPSLLLAPSHLIQSPLKHILNQPLNPPNHIFNLPHPLFPQLKPQTFPKLTQFLHNYTPK
ncbi:uroporphyrinogen decarboxylase family protein [Staphylococcus epidermidis]|uniref:uroporphyrinogen decarboxylase family protein n=1 Tax=Staphylococcus epidermidis TaxID=1282 RepID=UPI0021B41581|nr:uroporphyrinogen decarboxylase family protein [Staphylococcus epidermidis]